MSARRWARHRAAGLVAPGDRGVVYGGSIGLTLFFLGFWAIATRIAPVVWVPMVVMVGLFALSVPLCLFAAGRDGDRRLRAILIAGLLLKLLCVFPRLYVNEQVYDGSADAGVYHQAGQTLYLSVHEGRGWSVEGSLVDGRSSETETIGYITGTIYLVIGATQLGGFVVFTWLCWLGLLCAFRAFRTALPNAPPHLAAVLLFFLPSTLYWPSSIGKDALMVLCIGMISLGLARLLTPDGPIRGILLVIPPAWFVLQVRPHLLLIAMAGVGVSMFARSSGHRSTRLSVASRLLLLTALVPGLLFGMSRMDDAFGDPNEEQGFSVSSTLEQTETQTSIGGSAFETQPITNPLQLPVAFVSVLYRPFPFEVSSVPAFVSALEGTALLLFTVLAGRWLWRIGPAMVRHPFFAYCGGYVIAFVFAFSNIGNAGILARQRVQMFPVLMLLVAAAWEQHRLAVRCAPSAADPEPSGLAAAV